MASYDDVDSFSYAHAEQATHKLTVNTMSRKLFFRDWYPRTTHNSESKKVPQIKRTKILCRYDRTMFFIKKQ